MAGQPILRSYIKHLKEIDKKNPLDARILEAVTEGYSFNQIVKGKCPLLEDFRRPDKPLTWFIFYKWLELPREGFLKGQFKEVVTRARAEAQKETAHKTLEEAMEIVDNCEPDSESIQKAKLQFEARRWKAGSFNSQYKANSSTDIKVNISTQDLHLEALKENK